MKKIADATQTVMVTGDVTVDWNLACFRATPEGRPQWNAQDQTIACCQRGGAALLAQLLAEVAEALPEKYRIWPMAPVVPAEDRFHNSYAIWDQYDYQVKEKSESRAAIGKEEKVWRVTEFLGLEQAEDFKPQAMDDPSEATLVVLDDANLGYREEKNAWAWPKALAPGGRRPWIIIKMSSPSAQGGLWERLYRCHADRLLVILTSNDLRRSEVQVSKELSWESTALDLIRELSQNPRINALSRCAYVVVSFDLAGALLMEGRGQTPKYHLFFDPYHLEGMWERSYPGQMIGHTTCLAAGVAREIMLAPPQPNLVRGIKTGLGAMHLLHRAGYAEDKSGPRFGLTFPFRRIAQELSRESASFPVTVEIPAQAATQPSWTILQERYTGSLERVAQDIVRFGVEEVLKTVPLGRFGALFLVDRREIEGFRNLRNLIQEYYSNHHRTLPLSLAVFGPPGSGKSYGITQVAQSVLAENIEVKVFNLSQFQGPGELAGAFHQVRDISLRGKMPLVFWDEFDTALGGPLGWLQYFLAPMQDGTFQEGQITHPIGRAIFVFAGGTCETMEEFGHQMDQKNFEAVKGPDFASRLKGYVNILGPDRRLPLLGTSAEADPFYLIRRAVLLRSLIRRHWANLSHKNTAGRTELPIDPGVLRAFLLTKEYKHGARSMETIITNSRLAGKAQFERSALPPQDQLDLHVQGDNFLELLQQPTLTDDQVEPLAELIHQIYQECYPETSWPATYAELPEEVRESNRGFVRHIPIKLARLGYTMIPRLENEPPLKFSEPQMEELAEMEHERWMAEKIEFGWRYGPARDNFKKTHPALVPWRRMTAKEIAGLGPPKGGAFQDAAGRELPDEEKDKDRCLIKNIPRVLHEAGYAIVALRK